MNFLNLRNYVKSPTVQERYKKLLRNRKERETQKAL